MPARDGLMTSTELAAILDHPDLRLFDCTTYLEYQPEGSDIPYIAVPGRHTLPPIFRARTFWICRASSPIKIPGFIS
jgi:hypothetical protein